MKLLTTACAAAILLASASAAFAARAYIGTYTPEPTARSDSNHGEGIYLVDVNNATGALSNPKLVAKMLSPSWVTFSPDHKFLYANSEILNYGPDKTGTVTAYAVDAATGALKMLNTVSSGSAGPCYIAPAPSGKFVLVANYHGGSFAVIRVKADGSLGEITDLVKPSGPLTSDTAKDSQPGQFAGSDHKGSHGHMIGFDRSGKYVIGDDAGRDQIFVWTLDEGTGKLAQVSVTKSLPGSAPRHFVFSPDNKTMYQLQEQDSRLAVYGFANGKLTRKGATVSALPDGYQGSNTGSELLLSNDGKYVYFANRTQDSIATFAVNAGGVTRVSNSHTGGNNPRSLTLDPGGKFIYSLNQGANNVVTFRIGADGIPKYINKTLALGTPAVMVFLP